jgi:hypothetical protein
MSLTRLINRLKRRTLTSVFGIATPICRGVVLHRRSKYIHMWRERNLP